MRWWRNQAGVTIVEGLMALAILGAIVAANMAMMSFLGQTKASSVQKEKVTHLLKYRLSHIENANGCAEFLKAVGVNTLPLPGGTSIDNPAKVLLPYVRVTKYTLFVSGQEELDGLLRVNRIQLTEPFELRREPNYKSGHLLLSIDYSVKDIGDYTKTVWLRPYTSPATGQIIGCKDLISESKFELAQAACLDQGFFWDRDAYMCRFEGVDLKVSISIFMIHRIQVIL